MKMTKNKELNLLSVKKAFVDFDQNARIERSKIVCLLVITLMPAGTLLDYFVYPEKLWIIFQMRIFTSLIGIVILFFLKSSFALKYPRLSSKGWNVMLMPTFFISCMIAITEGANSPYYAGLSLMLLVMHSAVHITFIESILFVLVVIGMYSGACFIHGPIQDIGILFNNLYFIVLTSIIVITGNHFFNKLRFREFSLRYELKANQQELQESNQKLIEMDKAKANFFANISHELRTPLTLLIGPLEKIMRREKTFSNPDTKEDLAIMYSNATRLFKLIDDLLDLVKLDSCKIEVKPLPIDLQSFINGLASSVKMAGDEKGLIIETYVEDAIGAILADQEKLDKIILNLVFNAIKFTPKGGRIDIEAYKKEGLLCISVKDTGIGIPEESLPNIFDRFYQADSSCKRRHQGSGIGLALVKELAMAHNGDVTGKSREGKGSLFTLTIPYEPASATDARSITTGDEKEGQPSAWSARIDSDTEALLAGAEASAVAALNAEDEGCKTSDRPLVLLADDEPDMLRFLNSDLKEQYTIIEATDGAQAVENAKERLPDLIIMDMMMPEKDGLQASRELREYEPTSSIPIIMLTARVDENIKVKALSGGVNDFLTKPFSSVELHARAKNIIKGRQLQKELENALKVINETQGRLLQYKKLQSIATFSSGMLHEINNPLNIISTAVYVLSEKSQFITDEFKEVFKRNVNAINKEAERIQKIIANLKDFAHVRKALSKLALHEPVDAALRSLSEKIKVNNVQTELSISKDHIVWGNNDLLVLVFNNMIENALDACCEKEFEQGPGLISIKSSMEAGRIKLFIWDNGNGIEQDSMDSIFDPFFTTKDVGSGMGMGLNICYTIIEQHGGHIDVKSEVGRFTEFCIDLPAYA